MNREFVRRASMGPIAKFFLRHMKKPGEKSMPKYFVRLTTEAVEFQRVVYANNVHHAAERWMLQEVTRDPSITTKDVKVYVTDTLTKRFELTIDLDPTPHFIARLY